MNRPVVSVPIPHTHQCTPKYNQKIFHNPPTRKPNKKPPKNSGGWRFETIIWYSGFILDIHPLQPNLVGVFLCHTDTRFRGFESPTWQLAISCIFYHNPSHHARMRIDTKNARYKIAHRNTDKKLFIFSGFSYRPHAAQIFSVTCHRPLPAFLPLFVPILRSNLHF